MNQKFAFFLLIVTGIFILLDLYLWNSFQKTISPKYLKFIKWLIPFTSLLFLAGMYLIYWRASQEIFNANKLSNFLIGIAVAIFLSKLIILTVFLLEDISRIILHLKDKIFVSKEEEIIFPSRRKFVKNISLALAAIPLLGTLYAITKGKYSYQVKKLKLKLKRLPPSFNGFKIVQFTDFHAGSFDDYEKVQQGLDIINELNPDLILFTGDLVNNRAVEALPYLDLLNNLKAKYGKFAILGNHDYGDYLPFDTPEERENHLKELEDIFQKTGFQLLNNSSLQISIGNEKIDLVGVENWGSGRFPRYGDINKALEGLSPNRFKILMSHDPDHWEYIIRKFPIPIDLTLSGHTHGFQAGVHIPGWKWSPAKYRYKQWLGHYQENDRHLFVSKGFGFLGYPGRIGMLPEIVAIELLTNESTS